MRIRVTLFRTDVSEEGISSIMKVERIRELGTKLAVNRNWSTLMMEAIISFEMSVLTRATRRHIPEEGILHIPCKIFKTYKIFTVVGIL
jgi:hypothetical protein